MPTLKLTPKQAEQLRRMVWDWHPATYEGLNDFASDEEIKAHDKEFKQDSKAHDTIKKVMTDQGL